jgi:hypothetical protein
MQSAGKLTRKQDTLMSALLTAPRLMAAAKQAGLSEVTAWRWLKQDAFQTAYREARRAIVQHAITQVQQVTSEAVATLRKVMKETAHPTSAKVSAAKTVLETAMKAVALEDIEARITALEHAMQPQERGR